MILLSILVRLRANLANCVSGIKEHCVRENEFCRSENNNFVGQFEKVRLY